MLDIDSHLVLPQSVENKKINILTRINRKIGSIFNKNNIEDKKNYPPYKTIDFYYWKPTEGVNFGDELSKTVVTLMLARKGFTLFDEVQNRKNFLEIGSVLSHASDKSVIWGSGLNGHIPERDHRYSDLDVRAVRGPLTGEFLKRRGIRAPEIYGDPALLLPILLNGRFKKNIIHKIGIIPHFRDYERTRKLIELEKIKGIQIIDAKQSWKCAVEQILQCEIILSSSLHGLVIADAYGIPNNYIRISDEEPLLKFHDYYLGTNRNLSIYTSLKDAVKSANLPNFIFNSDILIEAFPYDIWTNLIKL